ncbi:uncharacterized protein [Typha latifolia]|uniref:uncharacterized protein n=1 Tax=Typha latifolia TaxID=4733 RepID=UPI003C2C4194
MEAGSSMNSGAFTQPPCNQMLDSLQPRAVNNSTGMTTRIVNYSDVVNGTMRSSIAANTDMTNDASRSIIYGVLLDMEKSLMNGSLLSLYWSHQELTILRDGLARYANEPSLVKYIKIAAAMPNKTVRDVATRCQWMIRKKNVKWAGNKRENKKDSQVDSSLTFNVYPNPPESNTAYSSTMHNSSQCKQISCQATSVDGEILSLFDENYQLLKQIATNLETCQIQGNIDLFYRTRKNITDILERLNGTAGTVCQMPPLPVSVDDNLFLRILRNFPMALL